MKIEHIALIRNIMYIAIVSLVVYSFYTSISNHEQRLRWLEMDAEYIGKEVELLKDKNGAN